MGELHRNKYPPLWLSVGVALLLFMAPMNWPYGFYQVLRLVVTGYAAYICYIYFRNDVSKIGWIFCTVGLYYNPLIPVWNDKDVHTVVNLITAGMVLFELYVCRTMIDKAANSSKTPTESERSGTYHNYDDAKAQAFVEMLECNQSAFIALATIVLLMVLVVCLILIQ